MMFSYESGILLHPTSLPGSYGVGEFGPAALKWLDQLRTMGQRIWLAYTGTHDNNTVVGWFHDQGSTGTRSPEQCEKERRACCEHLGIPGREIHWETISALLRSRAGAVIFPLQDVLGLGTEARMNIPGTMTGNWRWRLLDGQLNEGVMRRLLHLTRDAGRSAESTLHELPVQPKVSE